MLGAHAKTQPHPAMVMIIAGGMEIMIIGRKLGLGSFV